VKNKFVFKSRYRLLVGKLRNMFTVHHLWGRTLNKHHQECAVAYADDAYIKILVKGISAADFHRLLLSRCFYPALCKG